MARQPVKLLFHATDREAKRRAQTSVGILSDGWWELELSPRRPSASQRQRGYFHGVVVRAYYEFLRQQEYTGIDEDYCYELLKARMLPEPKPLVDVVTGEVLGAGRRSTADMDTADYSDFVERCRAYLADMFHIETPDPDPTYGLSAPAQRRSA
jgi:prophage antirepressor-like protein